MAKRRKKKQLGFGSSEFLVPTLIGAGVGASLGFLSPPLSVQGAVAGASLGGMVGLSKAKLRKKLEKKISKSVIARKLKQLNKLIPTGVDSKIDLKKHTVSKKHWTALEKSIMKRMS